MNANLAEFVAVCATESDQFAEVNESYSGRFMYGETTAAVECDNLANALHATVLSLMTFISATEAAI